MYFSLTSLVRLLGILVLGSSALAIVVARAAPSPPEKVRTWSSPRYYGVNGGAFLPPLATNFVLDAQTGSLSEMDLDGRGAVEFVACSPWTDERGEPELLGRLSTSFGREGSSLFDGAWLVRFGPGDRQEPERYALEPVIVGRPCWVPGRPDRVIVPNGDGRLRVHVFEDDASEPGATGASRSRSRALNWTCEPPGSGEPILSDPIIPAVPALGGRMLVALNERRGNGPGSTFLPTALWWLELDATGTAIVAAGRLAPEVEAERSDERLPNVAVAADGRILLASLVRRSRTRSWRLRVAPIHLDPRSGRPSLRDDERTELGEDFAVTIPAFSPDGRWVYGVSRRAGSKPVLQRYPLDGKALSLAQERRGPGQPG